MSSGADDASSKTRRKVNDDEKKSQNATINRIQRYRDDIAEYQLLFAQNQMSNDVNEGQQHRAYHELAKGFCQLLKPYLTDEGIPQSDYYWGEVPLGKMRVDPPEAIRPPSREEMGSAVRQRSRTDLALGSPRNTVQPKVYRVDGLRDFATAPPEWEVEWTVMFGPEVSPADIQRKITDRKVRVTQQSHRNEPITVVRTEQLSREIINNAVTAMENFVRDLGMDIEMTGEPYEGDGGPGI